MIRFRDMVHHVLQNPLDMFIGGRIVNLLSAAFRTNETRPFQQPQMMAGQGRGNPDLIRDFPYIPGFNEATGDNPETRGIAQQMENFSDLNSLVFDHFNHSR